MFRPAKTYLLVVTLWLAPTVAHSASTPCPKLAFSILNEQLVFSDVRFAGSEVFVRFSTGLNTGAASRGWAKQSGAKMGDSQETSVLDGNVVNRSAFRYASPTKLIIQCKTLMLKKMQVFEDSSTEISELILPRSTFKNFALDFEQNQMFLSPKFVYGNRLLAKKHSTFPVVQATLDKQSFSLAIRTDIGRSRIDSQVATQLIAKLDPKSFQAVYTKTKTGRFLSHLQLYNVRSAGMVFPSLMFEIFHDTKRKDNHTEILFGIDNMQPYNWMFSRKKGLTVERNSNPLSKELSFGLRMSYSKQGGQIEQILENGPAEKAGLQVRDIILSVNAMSTKIDTDAQYQEMETYLQDTDLKSALFIMERDGIESQLRVFKTGIFE